MKLCEIVPVEECSFLAVEKPQRMRLSAEQVKLNFGSRSPWTTGHILFRQDPAYLYLWFVQGQTENRSGVQIPEGYLLAKPYLDHSEAILVIKKKSGEIYTVIHKKCLVAQMVSALATDAEHSVEENVSLLEKEFSMDHPEVIHIPEEAVPKPSWKDLWDFLGVSADRTLMVQTLEWAKGWAIAMLAGAALYGMFNHSSLQRRVENKEQQLKQMQEQNSALRQQMLTLRRESEFWREFLASEAGPVPWLELMDALAASFKAQRGYLKSIRFSGNELIVQAGLNGTAPNLVKQLLATGLFAESKIISTEGDPDQPGADLVNIRLLIQSLPEVADG